MKEDNLLSSFNAFATRHPEKCALVVGEKKYSYKDLLNNIEYINCWFESQNISTGQRIGILSNRNIAGVSSIYAAIWRGLTYVPLNPKLPIERLKRIIQLSDLSCILCDELNAPMLESLIDNPKDSLVLSLDSKNIYSSNLSNLTTSSPKSVNDSHPAYLMFTSGTSGEPKGILATVGNLKHYLKFQQQRYRIIPSDRLSQFFEFSFDASIFDLFMSVNNGASLYVVPDNQLMAPVKFIEKSQLTVWFAVPSVISAMKKAKMLTKRNFSTLRVSIFGGEPFSANLMQSWHEVAPNSIIDNVYGPTETTVTCFVQECTQDAVVTEERGTLAIGRPYAGMYGAVIDKNNTFVPLNTQGELLIAGPQLTQGYWRDNEKTGQKFKELEHPLFGKQRWYFTGDLVYEDEKHIFHHLGRLDNQIKLSGYRVELEEVEAILRKASNSEEVTAIAWPLENGVVKGVVGFIANTSKNIEEIRDTMMEYLPSYMIPRRFIIKDHLPTTLNGKIDRKKLLEQLQSN